MTLTSGLSFGIIVSGAFEVGMAKVCGCILGLGSVVYHFGVTVALTSDLISVIIVNRAYLLYYLR